MTNISVREAARAFLAGVAGDVAVATHNLYTLYVDRFVTAHGAVALADVTPAMVRTWGRTYHPVQAVQRMLSWCHREARLIATNPLEGMRKMPRGRRLRTLTPTEAARLIRAAKGETRRFLIALRETFARPGELRSVRWDQVRTVGLKPFDLASLKAGEVFFFFEHFKGQKRRRDPNAVRVIPVSKRLGRLLARLHAIRPDARGQIFLNRRGQPWSVNAVRCALRQLNHRTGTDHDQRGERIVAYTFRHTAATNAVVAGVPVAELAGVLGHNDIRQTFRYVHLSPTFLKTVMDRIDAAKAGGKVKNGRLGSLRPRPDDSR